MYQPCLIGWTTSIVDWSPMICKTAVATCIKEMSSPSIDTLWYAMKIGGTSALCCTVSEWPSLSGLSERLVVDSVAATVAGLCIERPLDVNLVLSAATSSAHVLPDAVDEIWPSKPTVLLASVLTGFKSFKLVSSSAHVVPTVSTGASKSTSFSREQSLRSCKELDQTSLDWLVDRGSLKNPVNIGCCDSTLALLFSFTLDLSLLTATAALTLPTFGFVFWFLWVTYLAAILKYVIITQFKKQPLILTWQS